MKFFIYKTGLIFCLCMFFGCMTFTQEDYDLQQKKYERDRQVQEQKDKESLSFKW
jgi:hypothetical protein